MVAALTIGGRFSVQKWKTGRAARFCGCPGGCAHTSAGRGFACRRIPSNPPVRADLSAGFSPEMKMPAGAGIFEYWRREGESGRKK